MTNPEVRAQLKEARDTFAIPPDAIARAIAFAIEQPSDVDVMKSLSAPRPRVDSFPSAAEVSGRRHGKQRLVEVNY